MSVPVSVDHRVRMLIWGWAVEGYGWKDIEVMLRRQVGEYVLRREIWAIVVQARKVKR